MKKLKIESLEVASFVTSHAATGIRGTMHAHANVTQTGGSDVVVGQPPTTTSQPTIAATPTFFSCPTDTAADCTFTCTYTDDDQSLVIACVAQPYEPNDNTIIIG